MSTMVVPYAIKSYYRVIVHEAEEGGYWGEVLELPGCVSQGETIDEFRQNIREAMEAVFESESEAPHIEFYTEPTESIQFGMSELRGKLQWVEGSEASTATV